MHNVPLIIVLVLVAQPIAKKAPSNQTVDALEGKLLDRALNKGLFCSSATLGNLRDLRVSPFVTAKGNLHAGLSILRNPTIHGSVISRSRRVNFILCSNIRSDVVDDQLIGEPWGPWDPPLPLLDPHPAILTCFVARDLLAARATSRTMMDATLDFGLSTTSLEITDNGVVRSDDGALLATWEEIEEVADDDKGCYVLQPGIPVERFQVFSNVTNHACSLMPTGPNHPPTALIAGFSMHRFGVAVDPREDTQRKIGAIAPIRMGARVLDICTGLAYTAIAASTIGKVTTIELDPTMTQLCQINPHSRTLFKGGICQLYGNAAEVVKSFPNKSFDIIIHDPPAIVLAGELYSQEFYSHLHRLLTEDGKLYHYVGDPTSKSKAKTGVANGVVQRLKRAGFGGVAIDYAAHGIVAAHGRIRVNKHKAQKGGSKIANDRGISDKPGKGKTVQDWRRWARDYDYDWFGDNSDYYEELTQVYPGVPSKHSAALVGIFFGSIAPLAVLLVGRGAVNIAEEPLLAA